VQFRQGVQRKFPLNPNAKNPAPRIATIGELTASIAHEVNQPLAAVVANADACVAWLSREKPDLAEARSAAERATQGATRASEVIARIRSLITKATPEKSRVPLNRVIEQTAALAEGQAARNHVAIKLELSPALLIVLCDSIQLQQVILNLIVNGIEAMTTVTDRPRMLTLRTEPEDKGQVRVSRSGLRRRAERRSDATIVRAFLHNPRQGNGYGTIDQSLDY